MFGLDKPKAPATSKTPALVKMPLPVCDESKYTFLKPETVKFVERDDFINGLCGVLPPLEPDVCAYVIANYNDPKLFPEDLKMSLYYIASYYKELIGRGARLPKFTKWMCSLFPNEKRFPEIFAAVGQKIQGTPITVSNRKVDILRAADSPHFSSCFKGSATLNQIAEKAPGMGVIYSDDKNGKMKLRMWLMHLKDSKGKDAIGLGRQYGLQLDMRSVAQMLSSLNGGIKVYQMSSNISSGEAVTAVNGFDKQLYFDFNCWGQSKAALLAG
jgi:hypothetical protein